MISKEELEYLAQISKINLNENESRKFPKQLDKTIEYIDILEELASDDSVILDLQEMKIEDGFLRGPKMK